MRIRYIFSSYSYNATLARSKIYIMRSNWTLKTRDELLGPGGISRMRESCDVATRDVKVEPEVEVFP